MKHLFEARHVTKAFTGHLALNDVSIQVPNQSIFGLLGPNGAGKTTLIRIINQITGPDTGELLFDGRKLKPDDTALIGYLPEERGLYKKMKVGEQALYLAQLKGLSRHDAMTSLRHWFRRFEIEAWWNKKVEELSKGMQQKVQFIVTVIHKPQLLIFDEPFSGFDPINVNILKEEILRLKDDGATIIFSTHNMASVEELCDHIVLINKAQTILSGSVADVKQTYKSNTFEVTFSDFRGHMQDIRHNGFEIISATADQGDGRIRAQLRPGQTPNDLLAHLMRYAIIHSMVEIIPSMNEIFIQRVNEDKQQQGGNATPIHTTLTGE